MAVMSGGVLQQYDAPDIVYNHPVNTFVAGFLASPPMNLLEMTLSAGPSGAPVMASGGLRLTVPDAYAQSVKPWVGKTVILGIRSEDLHEKQENAGWQPIEGDVVALEALGAEVILVLAPRGIPGKEISARLGRNFSAAIASNQRLFVDGNEIRLFDPGTTNAIARRA